MDDRRGKTVMIARWLHSILPRVLDSFPHARIHHAKYDAFAHTTICLILKKEKDVVMMVETSDGLEDKNRIVKIEITCVCVDAS
jgi:hypothetical protein